MNEKKTHEQFLSEFYSKFSRKDYEIVSEYVNAKTHISIKHLKCGNVFNSLPSNLIKGNGCPLCSRVKRGEKSRKTHEQFVEEVFNLVGNEYTVIGKYTIAKNHIKIKHNVCGTVNNIVADSFVRTGRRCSTCFGNKKLTQNEFKQRILEAGNGEYTVLGKYINSDTKIELLHKKCNKIYSVVPYHFFSGVRCSYCSGFNIDHAEFLQRVSDLVQNEYVVLGKYKNAYTKILMKHNVCGHNYQVEPRSFISNGSRCPECYSLNKQKNTEIFKKEVFNLEGNRYSVLGEYEYARKKLKMKHQECDKEFHITPNHFLRGNRCPFCSFSKGEKKIQKWLEDKGITFKPQYRFDDCRSSKNYKLPFDFAIFHEKKIISLIEYDGEQHFRPVKRFGGEPAYKETKTRDEIKNNYCAANEIPLLRIPYYEQVKINDILEQYFNQYLKRMMV